MKQGQWIETQLQMYGDKDVVKDLYNQYIQETGSTMSKESYMKYVNKIARQSTKVVQNKPVENELFDVETENKNDIVEEKVIRSNEEIGEDGIYKAVLDTTWIKTPEQLIEYLKIDTSIWELTKFTRNTWGSETYPCIQVKGEFKKRVGTERREDFKKIVQGIVSKFEPKKFTKSDRPFNSKQNRLLELALTDHHLGQLSDMDETMVDDYNVDIAVELAENAIKDLLKKAVSFDVGRVLLVLGNDFFNSDNLKNTTTKGTQQVEAARWQYTFRKGLEACINLIELSLDKIGLVDVVIVPGNHDFERSYYLGCALEQRYMGSNRVTVNNKATPRKYIQWGKNLICFTHGSDEAKGMLPILISREVPELWGNSKFIEVHKGHFHREQSKILLTNEEVGIKERVLPSLVARDDWHTRKGYMSVRESMAFIWDRENGCEAILKYHP